MAAILFVPPLTPKLELQPSQLVTNQEIGLRQKLHQYLPFAY